MSIGFRLTTKCKNISSFQESLDAVAARNNISASLQKTILSYLFVVWKYIL